MYWGIDISYQFLKYAHAYWRKGHYAPVNAMTNLAMNFKEHSTQFQGKESAASDSYPVAIYVFWG